ncbi:hypothetical protein BC833DRAFT_595802 [Globomyces pollinis-pini]|nr:hypothetical protein BC833DRAFT_595802 [Globomyces pollinis-pini]
MEWSKDGKRNTLIVFIHGFMGSAEDSFGEFPFYLQDKLTSIGHSKIDCIVYPSYETRGNNQRQVQKLMDWLILHASTARYESVFLCAHSMGGILAADAYRYLYKVDPQKEASRWDSVRSYFSYAPDPNAPKADDMRFLVNIKGIITFDSPFYGLHSKVISVAGVGKAQEVAVELPRHLPKDVTVPMIAMIPDSVSVPTPVKHINVPISTKWVKDTIYTKMAEEKFETNDQLSTERSLSKKDENPPSEAEADAEGSWSGWTKGALGVGAVATVAATAFGAASAIVPLATSFAVSGVEELRTYAAFLEPLTTSHQTCHDRVLVMSQEHQASRLHFKAFFNALPSDVTEREAGKLPHEFTNPLTFCITPPEDVSHHFEKITNPFENEIDAHMCMFHKDLLGDEHYFTFLDAVSLSIHEALLKFKSE